jgi:hypothetical protein
MGSDLDENPVSQRATQVFLGCFVGWAVLAFLYYGHNHMERSNAFRITLVVISLLSICSGITYFRPRALPAFITSTAWVSLIVMWGAFEGGSLLERIGIDGWPATTLMWGMITLWLVVGIYWVRAKRPS